MAVIRKSIEDLQADAGSHGMHRALGPLHLVLFGIGCILGAGIYVLPGTAAANFAGPAVMISFVLAGTACALTALCYAELASTMPVSGSSYSYCYASLGEVFAWGLGWILMLEYTLASSTLAVGFSSYLTSLLRDSHIVVPPYLSTPLVGSTAAFSLNLGRRARNRRGDGGALRWRAPVRGRKCVPGRGEGGGHRGRDRGRRRARSTRATGRRSCRRTRASSPSAGPASCAPRRSCSLPTSASRRYPRPLRRRAIRSATCRSASWARWSCAPCCTSRSPRS